MEVCPGSRVKYSRAEQSRRDECVSEERGNRRKARKQQGTRRAGRSGYQLINTNSNIVIAGISRLLLVLALALLSLCLGAVYLS